MAAGDPIDYSSYYTSIATALGTIASNSTDIKNSLATIATQTTIVASQTTTIAGALTSIESHQNKLRQLGEGPGIHIIGAYESFGMVTLYRLLIEQAKILDSAEAASASQIQAAITEATRIAQLIRSNVPKEF
jgi:hypothetical protein